VVDTRHEYSHLFDIFVPIGLVVFAIFAGSILYAVLRYRRGRRDRPRARSEAPIAELTYVAVLAGIVAVLVSVTFNTEAKVDRVAATAPALEVDVTAAKWTWRFVYPSYGITIVSSDVKPATLFVPTNQVVRFRLASVDVIHSFYIPALRFKRDAFPGKPSTFDLVFSSGRFMGECAEFCGLHHADMRFDVEGMAASAFGSWAQAHRQRSGP
jgi:cytochrome c oxidase subunit 2